MDAARDRGRRLTPRPFLLVNPRSGGGRPGTAELVEEAGRLGVAARELGPGEDAAEILREAVERGAPAVGMAGGDGSLAPAAAVALELDVPLAVVPFGTENHFARDAGIDRGDPLGALRAFGGAERRVDVGTVAGRVFLNNVSLGVYASLVHDPRHERRNRAAAALRLVGAVFGRSRRPLDLSFEVEGHSERRRALLLLVANNDYGSGEPERLGRRERLDEGLLHAYVLEAVGRGQLVRLLALAARGGAHDEEGYAEWASPAFRVDSHRRRVHAAIDGEPVVLEPPLDFAVRPRALRLLLPPSGAEGGDERPR